MGNGWRSPQVHAPLDSATALEPILSSLHRAIDNLTELCFARSTCHSEQDLRVPTDHPTSVLYPEPSESIFLSGGLLRFNIGDIPDPPALTFVHDVAKLDRMWDDSAPSDVHGPACLA